jgi:hypothetical protein
MFKEWDLFPSLGERRKTPTLLDLLDFRILDDGLIMVRQTTEAK